MISACTAYFSIQFEFPLLGQAVKELCHTTTDCSNIDIINNMPLSTIELVIGERKLGF